MFRGQHRGAVPIALRSHFRFAQCIVLHLGLLSAVCTLALSAATRATTSVVRLLVVEGKDIRFTPLSTEKGLSESVVDHILQDDQGFIWFGTQDGLDRYDGYEFKIYMHEADNSGLSGGSVTALFKDRSGMLWVGEDQFLDRLDLVTQKIARYRSDPKNPNSLSGSVYAITQSSEGQLWLGTSKGLDKFDPATGNFTHYHHDPDDPRSLDRNGPMNDIRFLGFDTHKRLWVETSAGINSFDEKTGAAIRYPQLRNRDEYQLQRVYEDRSGRLWIHSREGSGIGTFDPKTGKVVRYEFQTSDRGTPTAERVTTVLEDRNGVLWFGTGGAG